MDIKSIIDKSLKQASSIIPNFSFDNKTPTSTPKSSSLKSPSPSPSKKYTDNETDSNDSLGLGMNFTEPSSSSSSSKQTWGEYLATYTWKGWALIIFILAVLGLNIFTILGKGTDEITGIAGPLIKKIIGLVVGTTGQIISTTAEGAKSVINTTNDISNETLNTVQDIATPNPSKKPPKGETPPMPLSTTTLQTPGAHFSDNNSSSNQEQIGQNGGGEGGKSVHGPGWCYIGSDDAFRTCAKIGYDDLCMSGDIFPTHEVCVNPNLKQ